MFWHKYPKPFTLTSRQPAMLNLFGRSGTRYARPPWMVEVQKLQEQISAEHPSLYQEKLFASWRDVMRDEEVLVWSANDPKRTFTCVVFKNKKAPII